MADGPAAVKGAGMAPQSREIGPGCISGCISGAGPSKRRTEANQRPGIAPTGPPYQRISDAFGGSGGLVCA